VRRIGGSDRPSTSEPVHFDPPLAWSVRGIDGPIRARVDLAFERAEMPTNLARLKLRVEASSGT
jgi:hypothetical protein